VAAAADPPVGGHWLRAAVLGGGRAITYPPADEDEALLAEERAGDRYPPVGRYPSDGAGCRSCGPRRTPRWWWAERPLRQQAVVTSADAFLLLSRSYVRTQAEPPRENPGGKPASPRSTPNHVFPKFKYANVSETCLINVPRALISALGDREGPTATSGIPTRSDRTCIQLI